MSEPAGAPARPCALPPCPAVRPQQIGPDGPSRREAAPRHVRRPRSGSVAPGGRARQRHPARVPPARTATCTGVVQARHQAGRTVRPGRRRARRLAHHRQRPTTLPRPGRAGRARRARARSRRRRRERMPEMPDTAYFALAPDWICEVLSPSTEGVDRDDKMPIYAREGVRHAWLVDPIARTLEVYVSASRRAHRAPKREPISGSALLAGLARRIELLKGSAGRGTTGSSRRSRGGSAARRAPAPRAERPRRARGLPGRARGLVAQVRWPLRRTLAVERARAVDVSLLGHGVAE